MEKTQSRNIGPMVVGGDSCQVLGILLMWWDLRATVGH